MDAVLIDSTNYDTHLKQSSQPRSGTPDGNIYFDDTNNEIQIITAEELANIDFGSGAEANPLTNDLGITMQALYLFENQERRTDETLRLFYRNTGGVYKFAGAFILNRGAKLATADSDTGDDRTKIRGSGWIEYAGDRQNIDRIYHGVKSLVAIEATSQPYWTLVTATDEATLQAATWTDFNRAGPIDEAIQVYGDTAYGDTGAGDFDYTARELIIRLRPFGSQHVQTTASDTGIAEFSGFSAGYGIGETDNAFNAYDIADVYGGSQISPWTGMSLEKLATPQTETGFNEADGDFTWVLNNTAGGTVDECAAFLDALQMQDSDIDSGTGTYNGRKGRVWYTRDSQGRVVTASIGGEGLFIEGLSTSEKQNVIMTDDNGDQKTYPFYPEVRINVGAIAVADSNAWYHVFYKDGAGSLDFNTATAVTVDDSNGDDVKGNVATDAVSNIISFAYDYDGNTQAGLSAGVDKDCIVEVEGDGGASQALVEFTITRDAIINVTCAPVAETNA